MIARFHRTVACWAAVLASCLAAGSARSDPPQGDPAPAVAQPARPPATQPNRVLPELPPDPAVVKLLDSLGDNTAALLPGQARLVGEFNELARRHNLHTRGPHGRDFTIKMAWAPQRGRAFFCGANHGVPHKLNDVWEYDLAAHAWVLLWPPDFNARPGQFGYDVKNVVLKDGFLMTRQGAPVCLSHTWWGLTWEPNLRAMLWMGRGGKPETYGLSGPVNPGCWLYAFFPEQRKWEFIKCPSMTPFGVPGGTMEYVPEWGGAFWYANRGNMQMWLLDPAARTWKDLAPQADNGEAPIIESVMAYDPADRLLVAQSTERTERGTGKVVSPRRTFHFDLASRTWKKTVQGGEGGPDAPRGHDANSPLFYDPVGKACLLFEGPTRTLWSYDVKGARWARLAPQGDPVPTPEQAGRYTAYFDPLRNVLVLCFGRTVWVYRHTSVASGARTSRPIESNAPPAGGGK